MKIKNLVKQFKWRFLLVRFLVNAIAVAITAVVTPKIYFVDKSVWSWLLITVMLGVLNALLKPILQFLTLQFIFVTYGLVIVLVNALILWLLSWLFPTRFEVGNLLWALVGGLVLGLLSSFLESLLGLTMPIVPEEETALRQQLDEEAHGISWFVGSRGEAEREEPTLAIEPPEQGADAATPTAPAPAIADVPASGTEEGSPPPAEDEAEPAEPTVSEEPEPGPDPAEEEEEDRS
jgi:putative membrane protein